MRLGRLDPGGHNTLKELSCMLSRMQREETWPEVHEDLDLWLEDDLTAEQLPTVVSASVLGTGGCIDFRGGGCQSSGGCRASGSCGNCSGSAAD
jgi:hypothetical protein